MEDIIIAPSVLAADFMDLRMELDKIQHSGASWVHLDIMDGHFVPNISFGPDLIGQMRKTSSLFFDVHLMVTDPEKHFPAFIQAGAQAITFHYEAAVHHHRLLGLLKEKGLLAGISIVPSTPVHQLEAILDMVDLILVMSVNPGWGGQAFLESTYSKVADLDAYRKQGRGKFRISVDGGVNRNNGLSLIQAGADILVTGSSFFKDPDPADFVSSLQRST